MIKRLFRWMQRWLRRSQLKRLMRDYEQFLTRPVHEQVRQSEQLLALLERTLYAFECCQAYIQHDDCCDDPRLGQAVVGSDIINWFAIQYEQRIPVGEALPPFIPEKIDEVPLETIILDRKIMSAYVEASGRLINGYNHIRESPDYMKMHYVNRMYNPTSQCIRAMLTILNLACPPF